MIGRYDRIYQILDVLVQVQVRGLGFPHIGPAHAQNIYIYI